MIWYENLYIGESIPKKEAKIRRLKWKINHNKCLTNAFLIVLCRYGENLLEIIPAVELRQKAYPKQNLYVVGLAKGYDDALKTAVDIVTDVYKKTGGFQVKRYILQQKAGDLT
ncbi:hypothetical protein C823_001633 [Eubacterium plexicaudatum ASF492]|uniref:Uncharacterized protein n=1 Tax=Eubacterium plexicaudatum ASF492 TaxID=1235802 RepID=N2BCW0_9FIRM|nr:hypothetical protein C823_001633 [Eubacterium plexicaudatum ASF492]